MDGVRYRVALSGFDKPMIVSLEKQDITLHPWTLGMHFQALGRHVHVTDRGLTLDAEGLADDVLAHSGVHSDRHVALRPLALWWAAGGDRDGASGSGEQPGAGRSDWIAIGSHRVRLRAWTWRQRAACLERRLGSERAGPSAAGSVRAFDFAGYLSDMVNTCIVAVDPEPLDLTGLDSAATACLLRAVQDVNQAGALDLTSDMARQTVRICRALGWTPEMVWRAPAAQIDMLMALLEAAGEIAAPSKAATPRSRSGSSLAAHPDAVVFHFVEDPA